MILLDAVYINSGGGKILLDLFVREIIARELPVFFLLDKRIEKEYPEIEQGNKFFVKGSLVQRHLFYLKHKSRFSAVLVFGNVPPTIRLGCPVFTYFHNVLFIDPEKQATTKRRIINFLKSSVIKSVRGNTDFWVVQSNVVKRKLSGTWQIDPAKISVFPVFSNLKTPLKSTNLENDVDGIPNRIRFLYVSDGYLHKNHIALLDAFARYNNEYPLDSLTLTVSSDFALLCTHITRLQNVGVNIINKGFLSKELLAKEYEATDICLFPSLKESFGLGLIEAAQYGLPVISADLPYVKEVIIPSAVFNPYIVEDICKTLLQSRAFINKPAELIVQNRLTDLLDWLHLQKSMQGNASYSES